MDIVEKKKKKNQYLVKSKQIVRSVIREKTTKLGTKLSYFAAVKTVNNFHYDEKFPEICSFKIADFLDIMKVSKGVAYRKIKLENGGTSTAIREEIEKAIKLQYLTPINPDVLLKDVYDKNDYYTHNIFIRGWIQDGSCFFEINQNFFKEHFIHLNAGDFITTPLQLVSEIKTDYTIRFYDYFKSFVWGHSKEFKYNKMWKLEELKMLIGIDLAKSYINNIGSLKQKILDPVKKDINENTDILLDFKFVKNSNSHKITAIIFYAKMKSSFEIKKMEEEKQNRIKIKKTKDKIINLLLQEKKSTEEKKVILKNNIKSSKNIDSKNEIWDDEEESQIVWD